MISEWLIIAATLMAEAGGESLIGKQAVASVIHNRAALERSSGTYAEVCLAPKQFSCWNAGEEEMNKRIVKWMLEYDLNWRQCIDIAISMTKEYNGEDEFFEPTGKWTHYFNPKMVWPFWAKGVKEDDAIEDNEEGVTRIGNHLFMVIE